MRIGIDARSLESTRTGVGRILIGLLQEWVNEPHEFLLYFKSRIPDDSFLKSPNFKLRKLEPVLGRQSNFVFEHWLLPRALKSDGTQVLYSPSYSAPIFCPCPFVVAIHDISFEVHPEWVPPLDQIARRFASRLAARKAAKIITVSDFSRSEIIKHYNLPKEKVARVYQVGVGPEILTEGQADWKFPANPYSVFVGSFFNRRHIPEIVEAVKKINETRPFSLVLVGEDKTYPAQNIRELVQRANQEIGRLTIFIHKNLSDAELGKLYRGASSILLLSEYEGFGLPLLEGMALAVPVIIGPGSSLEEVANGAALISDPSSPQTIAHDVILLEDDKNLRQSLIEKGKARARDFNWTSGAKETLNIITNAFQLKNK